MESGIDLAPLLNYGIEVLGAIALAALSWVANEARQWIGVKRDSEIYQALKSLIGDAVKDAVDVAMALLGAKGFGKLHGLIDAHPIGNIQALAQLVAAQSQQGQFHRVKGSRRSVEVSIEGLIQRLGLGGDPPENLREEFKIHATESMIPQELALDGHRLVAGQLPLIKRLKDPAPGSCAGPLRLAGPHSWRKRLIISSSDMAASAPLLPALVPARSMACSMVSVVNTPKATGRLRCCMTCPRPLAHSPAT